MTPPLISTIDASPAGIQASTFHRPQEWVFDALAGDRSDAGVYVNPLSVLSHPLVWQAVNILTGDVGQIPLYKMSRRFEGEKEYTERDRRHAVAIALEKQPNDFQTPTIWKQRVMYDALLYGNHCSLITQNADRTFNLLPLDPKETYYEAVSDYQYIITTRIDDKDREYPYDRILHVRGLSDDGFWGLPAIKVLRHAFGLLLQTQKHLSRQFKQSTRLSGVLQSDAKWNVDAAKNLREEWSEVYAGAENAGKVAVLYEGLKFNPLSMTNQDAEMVELMRILREFVASAFGLPAYRLNSMENSSVRANLEEQKRDYMQQSLTRWTGQIAQEAERKLFTAGERRLDRHFLKWDFEIFLQSDIESRYEAYSKAITARVMNPNEARKKEGLNPYPGGDEFKNPAIDKQEAEAEPQQADDEESGGNEQEAVGDVMRQVVRSFLHAESNRATSAARGGRFTAWVDSYYESIEETAEAFLAPSSRLAESLGMGGDWRQVVREHGNASRTAWLAIADAATPDALPGIVQTHAGRMTEKTNKLADRILRNGK